MTESPGISLHSKNARVGRDLSDLYSRPDEETEAK